MFTIIRTLLSIVYDPKKAGTLKGFELEAVLFEFTDSGTLQMTASNGHMLATVTMEYDTLINKNLLIHSYYLKKVVKDLKGTLIIYPYGEQLYFADDKGGLVVADPSPGEFPDFKKVMARAVVDDTAVMHIDIGHITLGIEFLKATGTEIITVTRQPYEPGRPMLLKSESESGGATVLIMPYDPETVQ